MQNLIDSAQQLREAPIEISVCVRDYANTHGKFVAALAP
jgi:hypothetical protein